MNSQLLEKTKEIKKKYEKEGFIIVGVFGSYARDEEKENSDIDILYETTKGFQEKHGGFNCFERISDIQEELKLYLDMKVDVADRTCLDEIGRKDILPEVVYVA